MPDPEHAIPTPVESLVADALEGRLALPEFQRDFAWKPPAVRLLLSSVALGWPIGSFMIWSPGDYRLQAKEFHGVTGVALDEDKVQYLLDGQQRLTALIHALHPEYSGYRYFVRGLVEYLSSESDVEIEEHVDSLTAAQFAKRYPTLDDQTRADVALISDIVDDGKFSRWEKSYNAQRNDAQEPELFAMRALRLPGFKAYAVPCVRLGSRLELSAVARIFETTNRTGVKLGTVDLMTATLYPEFKLRDEWRDVVSGNYELREHFEGTLDAEDALRLLAFWKTDGKGVTRDQILKMKHRDVKGRWDDAVFALTETINFLRTECGVIQGSLLPQRLMVIPLAVAFDRAVSARRKGLSKARMRAELRQWFWYAVARGAFVRSTNTRAIRHAIAARSYVDGETKSIRGLLDGDGGDGAEDLVDRLLDAGRGERALEAAVLALVVAQDGFDWRHEQGPLTHYAGSIQAHHIIPRKAQGVDGWSRVDCIANLTPQSSLSNNQLGNDFPIDAGVSGQVASAHFCDFLEIGARDHGTFEQFVKRRADAIRDAIEALSGPSAP